MLHFCNLTLNEYLRLLNVCVFVWLTTYGEQCVRLFPLCCCHTLQGAVFSSAHIKAALHFCASKL